MISRDGEPVRVLMISPQFRPLVGGYERAAERLSVALAEAGMRVVVIAERRDRAWPAVECIDGYEVRRLSCSYRRHLHVVTSLLSFRRLPVASRPCIRRLACASIWFSRGAGRGIGQVFCIGRWCSN